MRQMATPINWRSHGPRTGDLQPPCCPRIHCGPVKEEVLRQLIDVTVQALARSNQQPWLFSVVRDKALLARISTEAKAHMLKTSMAAASHHFQSSRAIRRLKGSCLSDPLLNGTLFASG
jgi:nitroreductase